ncbi:MAG: hypothetical protein GX197_09895 [Firmicutes bacterium]|nr:hypothetical protein [Bacillota bacterium]
MSKNRLFIGQKITVAGPPEYKEIYASMIQELDEETITITLPVLRGEYLLLQPGDSATVEFTSDDAVYGFTTQVVGRKKNGEVSLLILARPKVFKRLQRRHLFRLPLVLPCVFQLLTEEGTDKDNKLWYKGEINNLSGSGLRLTCSKALKKDDKIIVRFTLRNGERMQFTLRGIVRWHKENEKKKIIAGIEFCEITPAEQEQIISFIFEQQRRRIPE